MSAKQLQPFSASEGGAVATAADVAPVQDWGGGQDATPRPSGFKIGRYISALKRYKWLIAILVVIGAAGGYGATKFLKPEYQVKSVILLEVAAGSNTDTRSARGPVQGQELLRSAGWTDLMRSFSIADPVVMQLALFVKPNDAADSAAFRSFRVEQQRLQPGDYVLALNGNRYTLSLKAGIEMDKGVVGDSIGRNVGFLWQPTSQMFAGRKEVAFRVQTPRETSQDLIAKMGIGLQPGSSLMFVTLTGENSARTAATLNAWVEQFVSKATALKKKNVMSYATILEGQRQYAADNLSAAEGALQQFRIQTVTQPNERQLVNVPGIELTRNPVFDDYYKQKVLVDGLSRDRIALERILATGKQDGIITPEAVLSVPMVTNDPASAPLRSLLAEQTDRENKLRIARESFTDEFETVKNELASLKSFKSVMVPRALETYLAELRLREAQLNLNIEASSKDLKGIPSRTIEEGRLTRMVDVADALYRSLEGKAGEAKLAEAATIPDVTILDPAVPPLEPTKNTAPVIILGATLGALALGIALAILIDQLDKHFRYPEQATDDLGLFVLGVVPQIESKGGRRNAEQAAQVVEAFRSIRMNVRYAADPARPLTMTITSPGPNDGKSLIASNLALSFAESGLRTLLIDGDLRRGELAKTFGVPKKPGLVEYLDGTALIAEVLHPVQSHANLTLIQGGARRRRAPELLATPRLAQMISQMAAEFDVVIVDSPPLGAGFDAFALATATGNLALVLRSGMTDRRMAGAKMATVDTLPVRVMGAILNGIKLDGVYQYYSYYQGYSAEDEDTEVRLVEGEKGQVPAVVSRN